MQQFHRTESLVGKEAQKQLNNSHVAVFGLGGVGSYVVEALARAGVGKLTLVDFDRVEISNINRQLFALHSTVGQNKAEVAKARVLDINPNVEAVACCCRFCEETQGQFDFAKFDYVVDAIDTVSAKLLLAERCQASNTRIISCMGTGNKLNPTAFEVADVFETSVCPLAKVMRKELKARGVLRLKVVYSKEQPLVPLQMCDNDNQEADGAVKQTAHVKQTPASISFVPPVAGMVLAGEVVKELIGR